MVCRRLSGPDGGTAIPLRVLVLDAAVGCRWVHTNCMLRHEDEDKRQPRSTHLDASCHSASKSASTSAHIHLRYSVGPSKR